VAKFTVVLDPHAPRTNAILGAALSGGDVRKLARSMMPEDDPRSRPTSWEQVLDHHLDKVDPNVFHNHLDVCKQCAEHPFALCPEGTKLLRKAAGV
jgi:hypothetical protein